MGKTSAARGTRATGRSGPSRRVASAVLAVLVFLVAGAAAVGLDPWSRLDGQARAAVVLVSFLEPPGLTPVIKAVTGEPRVEEAEVAGNPTSVFYPAGEGPHPAVVFVNGTIREGREYEGVRDLSRGFARAGYLVVVPDLPGLMTDTITPRTVSATVDVGREVSERRDVRDGKVGLVGVSTGASLALLTAEDRGLQERVSAVVGVAPYTDIKTVLSVATTGHYRHEGRMVPYSVEPLLPYVVGRSVISTLPEGPDREALIGELDAVGRYEEDPLAPLRDYPQDELGPEAGSVLAFLANQDPERFDELYRELPEDTREDLQKLSPLHQAERLEMPVELVSGPEDRYFPVFESYRLGRVAPKRNVTVTEVLDHSEVSVSLENLPDFLKLAAFAGRAMEDLRGGT